MFSQRGSLLISELVGIAGSVVLSAMVAAGARYVIPLAHDTYVAWVATSEVGDMQAQLTSYSTPAQTWFIPAKDIYGAAQVSGVGAAGATGLVQLPSPAPAEIDVAIKQNVGVTGTYSFYAFRYNSTTKEEEKIAYYTRRADGTALCAAATPCTTANTVVLASWAANSCTAGSLLASQIPSIDPLVSQLAAGKTIPDVSLPIGFSSDVQSSNKLYAIQCDFTPSYWIVATPTTNNYFVEQFQVTAGEPITTQNVSVTYSPPPIGTMTLTLSPNPIVLGYAGANGLPSSGSLDGGVTNYHHNFVLDGSTMSALGQTAPCSGIATLGLQELTRDASGVTNNPPSSYGGTWMQFNVTPTAVGKCSATVATQTGLSAPDNVVQSASATIIVEGHLTLNPTSLSFASPSAAAQSVSVSEPGYTGVFSVANGCNGYATAGSAGSGPSSSMPVSPVGTTTSPCTITVTDSNGESASVLVNVSGGSVESWPQQLVLGSSQNPVGMTSGASPLASSGSLVTAVGPLLNKLLAGGVADAASPSQPCYALGETTSYTVGANASNFVDLSLPASISAATGVYVDSAGCEVDVDDNPISAAQAGMIAFNSLSASSQYAFTGNSCSAVSNPGWLTSNNAPEAVLGTQGQTAGICSISFSGTGLNSSANAPDSGLVALLVESTVNEHWTNHCSGHRTGVDWDSGCLDTMTIIAGTNCQALYTWGYVVNGADINTSGSNSHADLLPSGSDWTSIFDTASNNYFNWLINNGWADQTVNPGPSGPPTLTTSGCT